MNTYEILKRSRYFPTEKEFRMHGIPNIENCPVDPQKIEFCNESCYIIEPAREAFEYVKAVTDMVQIEYSIVFIGMKRKNVITISDYYYAEGNKMGVVFTPEQKRFIKSGLELKGNEGIFGHTHVAEGVWYNHFSVNDLHYIVKKAVQYNRNMYGMLITKDLTFMVKYDIKRHEFYRVQVHLYD